MLVVDTNKHEDQLFKELVGHSPYTERLADEGCIVRRPLVVGDATLYDANGEVVWIFEVKRGRDWASSILDGRLANQRKRALESSGSFAYVFQGPALRNCDSPFSTFGKLSERTVYGSVMRSTLRDKIPVFRTTNTEETAEILAFALEQQLAKKLKPRHPDAVGVKAKRPKEWALENPTEAALLSIPGMGAAAAKAVAEEFESIVDVVLADEERLADIRTENDRRVGPALAAKIKNL